MLDAIGRRNAVRFVMTRGELGGTHMADGYARASGGLGVMFSSTGPGAANAVGGLIEARFAGSPLLHITGQTSTRFVDREMGTVHDAHDQLGMLRSVGKGAWRVRSAAQALGVLTAATVAALTAPTGPVSVEVPIDIQRTPIDASGDARQFRPAPCRRRVCQARRSWMSWPRACWRRSARCCGLAPVRSKPDRRRGGCSTLASAC